MTPCRTVSSSLGKATPLQGKGIDHQEFEEALTQYYETMSWGPRDGVSTRGKLAELNLYWLDEYIKDKRN